MEMLLTIASEYGVYAALVCYLFWRENRMSIKIEKHDKEMWVRADKREDELMSFINDMKDEMRIISSALTRVEHNVNEIRNERK